MKKLLLILTAIFSFNVFAGTGTGKITGVLPYTKGSGEKLFFVKMETQVDSPSCNATNRFVISDTNASFDIYVSALLAAYHSKTEVKIKGQSSCNYWSNSEDISVACFGDIPC